jgi:hypothetical protein
MNPTLEFITSTQLTADPGRQPVADQRISPVGIEPHTGRIYLLSRDQDDGHASLHSVATRGRARGRVVALPGLGDVMARLPPLAAGLRPLATLPLERLRLRTRVIGRRAVVLRRGEAAIRALTLSVSLGPAAEVRPTATLRLTVYGRPRVRLRAAWLAPGGAALVVVSRRGLPDEVAAEVDSVCLVDGVAARARRVTQPMRAYSGQGSDTTGEPMVKVTERTSATSDSSARSISLVRAPKG